MVLLILGITVEIAAYSLGVLGYSVTAEIPVLGSTFSMSAQVTLAANDLIWFAIFSGV